MHRIEDLHLTRFVMGPSPASYENDPSMNAWYGVRFLVTVKATATGLCSQKEFDTVWARLVNPRTTKRPSLARRASNFLRVLSLGRGAENVFEDGRKLSIR